MPLVSCSKSGNPGYKWGEENTSCFTYLEGDATGEGEAKSAAMRQATAIETALEEA